MKDIDTKKVFEDDKAMMSLVNSAFELSWALRALQNFLKDLREPSLVEKCLDVVIDLGFEGF